MIEDELTLADRLGNMIANFVGDPEYEFLLRTLFDETPGRWVDLFSLCKGAGELNRQLMEVRSEVEDHLVVTWLDYGNSDYGAGYCPIIFFSEAIMWSFVAIYNQAQLVSNL